VQSRTDHTLSEEKRSWGEATLSTLSYLESRVHQLPFASSHSPRPSANGGRFANPEKFKVRAQEESHDKATINSSACLFVLYE
jgi:hypothetical protein